MPTTRLHSALQAALANAHQGLPERTDADLLAAFASHRDETAFAELVRRHGRLVLGAARRVVRDADAAEDVFQAVFLLLAKKASSVSWGLTVAPWLYQSALRIAAKARARAARRRPLTPLGTDLAGPATDPAAELAWAEVKAGLDHALAALSARLRAPLVLCYLEGLTRDEAAVALGCSPAAIKGRIARGRERLRQLLARRGVSLSAALAGVLVGKSLVAAPVPMATAQAAVAFRATGAASPAVQELLRGTLVGRGVVVGLVGLMMACAAAALGMASGKPVADPTIQAAAAVAATAPGPAEPGTDFFGDLLPEGALARLGTRRLCGPHDLTWIAFSPDGTKVAAQDFASVTVWDAATGRLLVERQLYRPPGNAIGWRADGTGVAIFPWHTNTYHVSTFTDPKEALPPELPARQVNSDRGPDGLEYLALNPDATLLAVGQPVSQKQFTIDLLSVKPGRPIDGRKPLRTLGPFPGDLRDVRYTVGGGLVVMQGPWDKEGDWSLALIDPDKNAVVRTTRIPPLGYCPWQYMLSLSGDARLAAVPPREKGRTGRTAATNNHQPTIHVRDLVGGKDLWVLPFPQSGYGTGHAFTPDGKRLITSTKEHFFRIWDMTTGKETARSPAPSGALYQQDAAAVAVSRDGKRFAIARRDGPIDIRDVATGEPVVQFATHRDIVDAVAVSPDGQFAATLGLDGTVRLWELATGRPGCIIPAPFNTDPYTRVWAKAGVVFSPDGRRLLFTSGGKLAMAEVATGKLLEMPGEMRGRDGYVAGFAADGKLLVTFAKDVVTVWKWPTGTARVAITVPLGPGKPAGPKAGPEVVKVHSAALSPDGRLLFTYSVRWSTGPMGGSFQNTHDLWDARTGRRLAGPVPETQQPPGVFAPNSRVLYLGGTSMSAWDVEVGKLPIRFAKPGEGEFDILLVAPIAISPDGRLLAASAGALRRDQSVFVYETVSGGIIKKLPGHARLVTDLAFSPDGRRLVSVAEDQTGLVWDVALPALGTAGGAKPPGPRLDWAWDLLAHFRPRPAYTAMAALAAAPMEAVGLLRARLRPAPGPSIDVLDRLVRQLDAEKFADRERASADLDRLGPDAAPGIKARLGRITSPEVRERLLKYVNKHDDPSAHLLRSVRGVAVLESIGSADARTLLAELAKGPPDDPLTVAAREASRRPGR